MTVLSNFFIAFFFSFIGTIPPGSLNLNILQLGVDGKINTAWRFAIAAALIEYPYAWAAVKFEQFITSSPLILNNISLITAIVMTILGLFNLWASYRPSAYSVKFYNSGFRRGVLLAILNPLALPFWVGTTAYLNGQHWINLSSTVELHAYLLGVSAGALFLFMLVAYLAKRIVSEVELGTKLKRIPGLVLLVLGLYAFFQYLS
jgi:threonine/homoserine/homoserine lactone efflux protein